MSRNQTPGTVSVALLAIVVLASASGAWAQSKYKTLYKFRGGTDGSAPFASLIFDHAGNLYGTTEEGGNLSFCYSGCGVVFKLAPNSDGSWIESVIHSFCPTYPYTDGASPGASLIFDGAGNLYGTAFGGGAHGYGVVFRLSSTQDGRWSENVLYSFCSLTKCTDGANPNTNLIFDQAGNLYGTATGGGADGQGVVFQLTPGDSEGGWKEKVLHQFTGSEDGRNPYAGVTFDETGNLYGTTESGGLYDRGTVFQLAPDTGGGWKEKILHHFTGGTDGNNPFAGLIVDGVGNLYGTTVQGGNHSQCMGIGCGVVFRLTPNPGGSWNEQVLHQFTGGKDGKGPFAGLVFDQAGNLYSTTEAGGLIRCNGGGCGVVFRLTNNSNGWKETLVHSFVDDPGAFAFADVLFDAAGNLYGTTEGDGITTFGSVFEITP